MHVDAPSTVLTPLLRDIRPASQEIIPSKIVIADSHDIVREAIALRLSEGCVVDIVGEAADGYTTIKLCRQLMPEILFLDLQLSRPSGMETLSRLRQSLPDMKVVAVTSDQSTMTAFYLLKLGVFAIIPKQARGDDFVQAVFALQYDYAYLPRDVLAEFVKSRKSLIRAGDAFGLTPRETEVFQAIHAGMSSKEIAKQFEISVRTVETHRNSINRKTADTGSDEIAHALGLNE